ncbi:hypothetical protein [Streptomyces sp. NPDC048639]|uniref:hypothetical protein n=1 Tax=Streptomyces sp. NPDC048639 TaxID=3365581 RepID=UPI003713702F
MDNKRKSARTWARWAGVAGAAVVVAGLPAGAAHADETHRNSHNAPHMALVSTGQIDDPMEDVLEHTLLLGDGYRWD